jgi:hypothetical protein
VVRAGLLLFGQLDRFRFQLNNPLFQSKNGCGLFRMRLAQISMLLVQFPKSSFQALNVAFFAFAIRTLRGSILRSSTLLALSILCSKVDSDLVTNPQSIRDSTGTHHLRGG